MCLVTGYYDLYNTDTLISGQDYTYYRFYDNLEKDLYQELHKTATNYDSGLLSTIEIEPTSNYTARTDYHDIVLTSAILIIGLVILLNIVTSIIKRGGIFGDVF